MHTQDYSIQGIINRANHWYVQEDGSFHAYLNDYNDLDGPYIKVDVSEGLVAQAHPKLPALLRQISLKYSNPPHTASLGGDVISRNLHILNGDYVKSFDTGGRPVYLINIKDIKLNTTMLESPWVYVKATLLDTEDLCVNGEIIPMVVWSESFADEVSQLPLNKTYPGWQERFKIGMELGVPQAELMKHVFAHNVAPSVQPSISGVTFD